MCAGVSSLKTQRIIKLHQSRFSLRRNFPRRYNQRINCPYCHLGAGMRHEKGNGRKSTRPHGVLVADWSPVF
jgi:hypothetical protein